jgi:hypothetical protein
MLSRDGAHRAKPVALHADRQRAGRGRVSKTSLAGFESLVACSGERTWLGHGQAGNLCEPSGFRFESDALLHGR